MTSIEQTLLRCLATQGPIRGPAQVGYALWPDRAMQPQGAALAAGTRQDMAVSVSEPGAASLALLGLALVGLSTQRKRSAK